MILLVCNTHEEFLDFCLEKKSQYGCTYSKLNASLEVLSEVSIYFRCSDFLIFHYLMRNRNNYGSVCIELYGQWGKLPSEFKETILLELQ